MYVYLMFMCVCVYGVTPVGTAAGVRRLGEADQGDPTRWGSQDVGGPREERLWAEAWRGEPRGVKGAGEVGQRCEEGQGDGRYGGAMRR